MFLKIISGLALVSPHTIEEWLPYFEKVNAIADLIVETGNSYENSKIEDLRICKDADTYPLVDLHHVIEPNGGMGLEVIRPNARFAGSRPQQLADVIAPFAIMTPFGSLQFIQSIGIAERHQYAFTNELISRLGLIAVPAGVDRGSYWGTELFSITRDRDGAVLPEVMLSRSERPLFDMATVHELWEKVNAFG